MNVSNILQLLGVLVAFVLILAATYYATKWFAKSGIVQSRSANIKVIETFKIAQNKYIQIIQLGDRYYSIGVTKDEITFLTALDEEQLDLSLMENAPQQMSFKDMLGRVSKLSKNKQSSERDHIEK